MPRDSSGNYTLPPAYNPVLTGTTITSAWANTTMNDIATALTDSLSRSGRGGLTSSFLLTDGTALAPGLAFASELSTGLYRNGASQPTFVVGGVPIWSSDASKHFLVEASGGTIISSATVGYSLTVNGPLGITIPGAAATQLTALNMAQAGQQAWSIYQLASSDDFRIYNSFSGDVIRIQKQGYVTIFAPQAGGAALSVIGVASQPSVYIINPSAAGTSYGLSVNAGANTSDYCISAANSSGNGLWYLQGNGENFVLEPPAFTDRTGSNYHQAGYLEIPQNYQPNSYTFHMSDRGKNVFYDSTTAGNTYTIPLSGSVNFPVGTTITMTVVQGGNPLHIVTSGGDILRWIPNNDTTQPRNLGSPGLATMTKMRANEWWITGVNIS